MENADIAILKQTANAVRALSADAIELQKSGHPGLPLGAADIAVYLYARVMRHNPENPGWIGRDRFVLSAGHGSMLLYSLLHLFGYGLTMDDLKKFRQLHSRTPGHPEYGEAPGVETTTGPLGQGIAAATGMAMAQKFLAQQFDDELFDAKIYVLAGDGCIMEGITSEAGSLAGSLGLNNLVIIYDSNDICLDGPTEHCLSENTQARYESYGFKTLVIDGYDYNQMAEAFDSAQKEKDQPFLIIAKTVIGKFSPTREGKSVSHGNFLGPEEMSGFKKAIGWPEEPTFYVPNEVKNYLKGLNPILSGYEKRWNAIWKRKVGANPELLKKWNNAVERKLPDDFEQQIWQLDIKPDQATRFYNAPIVNKLSEILPYFVTGSADVASSDNTALKTGIIARGDWAHQQIKFGVREFAMAACAYGMQLHGMIQPAVATFLTFSDYMRNALRMAAMMKQRVIYLYSHDSILIAADGPTHQPVEHLMSLRLIPNLVVLRPCDENEVKAAWIIALEIQDSPVAITFTRQPVKSTVSDITSKKALAGVRRGAYVLYGQEKGTVDYMIFATGSEVHAAVGAAKLLEKEGRSVCVVSVTSWELFDKQDENYRKSILERTAGRRVSVEAGIGLGWQKFTGNDGLIISQETYGTSAPEPVIEDYFGFSADKVYQRIKSDTWS
jgi:transketolase